jgi:hypothetical protein
MRRLLGGVVRAAGFEPAQALLPYGFSYQLRLSPPRLGAFARRRVCGLDYPFALARAGSGTRGRRHPSSLYTFPSPGLARDCHLTGFPEFGQFYFSVSRRALKLRLSPLRLPISPRPRDAFVISGPSRAAKGNLAKGNLAKGNLANDAKPIRRYRLPVQAPDRHPRPPHPPRLPPRRARPRPRAHLPPY